MSVEIKQIDPFAHRDAVFRVYCDSLGVDRFSDAAREWRDNILPRHATRADFDFRAAVDTDDGIVGFVYGYTGAYGQWWTDRVASDMSDEARRVWLDPPHFEVVQLHVLPSAQRTGIGARLLDTLLEHQPNDRALLSMDPQSATAGPFYRKHGWRTISTTRLTRACERLAHRPTDAHTGRPLSSRWARPWGDRHSRDSPERARAVGVGRA